MGLTSMHEVTNTYHKWDFWVKENLNYSRPHFRMEKAARLINKIAGGRTCDLLDVGCGPGSLKGLLESNVSYFGIDIAIQNPAPNFIQSDFVENPICFAEKQFDLVIAQGVFEYVGKFQEAKFGDIDRILKKDGVFIVSYVNFDHYNRQVYWPYNNVQPFQAFYESLSRHFQIKRHFATSHRWHHDEPRRFLMRAIQKHINVNIPLISRLFAVEYFFVCTPKLPLQ